MAGVALDAVKVIKTTIPMLLGVMPGHSCISNEQQMLLNIRDAAKAAANANASVVLDLKEFQLIEVGYRRD